MTSPLISLQIERYEEDRWKCGNLTTRDTRKESQNPSVIPTF